MKIKITVFFVCLILLTSCNRVAHVFNSNVAVPPKNRVNIKQDSIALANINSIDATQNLILKIYTNNKQSNLMIKVNNVDKKAIKAQYHKQNLQISNNTKKLITVNLYLKKMDVLTLYGNSTVIFANSNKFLNISTYDKTVIQKLFNTSYKLNLTQHDNSIVNLTGWTQNLNIELWDNSVLNGQNFKATKSFIKTHNHSSAYINSSLSQHALASNASDIYYHQKPEINSEFMGYNGSVLQLGSSNSHQKDLK